MAGRMDNRKVRIEKRELVKILETKLLNIFLKNCSTILFCFYFSSFFFLEEIGGVTMCQQNTIKNLEKKKWVIKAKRLSERVDLERASIKIFFLLCPFSSSSVLHWKSSIDGAVSRRLNKKKSEKLSVILMFFFFFFRSFLQLNHKTVFFFSFLFWYFKCFPVFQHIFFLQFLEIQLKKFCTGTNIYQSYV